MENVGETWKTFTSVRREKGAFWSVFGGPCVLHVSGLSIFFLRLNKIWMSASHELVHVYERPCKRICSRELPMVVECFFSRKIVCPNRRDAVSLDRRTNFHGGLPSETFFPLVSQGGTLVSQDRTLSKTNAPSSKGTPCISIRR